MGVLNDSLIYLCSAVYSLIYASDLFITTDNTLYIRPKLTSYFHILKKIMDAQGRTGLISDTKGVGCASCICGWGINSVIYTSFYPKADTLQAPKSAEIKQHHCGTKGCRGI